MKEKLDFERIKNKDIEPLKTGKSLLSKEVFLPLY